MKPICGTPLLIILALGICKLNLASGDGIAANFTPKTTATVDNISHLLQPLLSKYGTPALGGLLLDVNGTLSIGATGVRKLGKNINVTVDDLWHMGSVTKAMTATLVARLVETGKASWNDTVGSIFSRLNLRPEFNSINFLHLLNHRSGIPPNADWYTLSQSSPTIVGPRVNCIRALNDTELLAGPGEQDIYSNWGYTVAGAMLEEVMGESYEELMKAYIFHPLGMDSVGYGVTSRPNEPKPTQPWGHQPDGTPIQHDNPLIMSPAGTVHCTLEDWAKFVRDHLRGHLGLPGLLKAESYERLHTAPFGGGYALGWAFGLPGFAEWTQGISFWHNGSNTYNMAIMVMDPVGGIAAISTCNQANGAATDDVMRVIVTAHQQRKNIQD